MPRGRRRTFVPVLGALTLLAACNAILGNEDHYLVTKDAASTECLLPSDCPMGNVCLFKTCSPPCRADEDCDPGERCLKTEKGTACVSSTQDCTEGTCPAGSVCTGGTCRNECGGTGGDACRSDQICSAGVCVGKDSTHDPGTGLPEAGAMGGAGGTGGAGGAGGRMGAGGVNGTGGRSVDSGAAESGSGGAGCRTAPVFQLSEAPGKSVSPRAVWTGDGYAVAWQDDRDGNTEIYFARLDAEGRKLGGDVRITNDPGESASPVLVWAASELGLSWSDRRDGNAEIYFARIDRAGNKIGGDVRVTSDPARSEFPSLVGATNGGYAVAWNDTRDGTFQIYTALLDGSGTKVGPEVRVSGGTALSASPCLVAGGTGYGIAWYDLRGGAGLQIYFARLDAAGARIGGEIQLSVNGGGEPTVASNGSGYAVAWGSPSGSGEVTWVSVDAGGAVVGSPIELSSSQNTAAFPSMIARGTGYAIAWPDGRDGDREIYVAELDETGTKLTNEIRVSNDATASLGPSLARSTVGYGVVWIDDATTTTGEVMFRYVCP